MPIEYTSKIVDDYLHIVAQGSVCSIEELMDYIDRIHGDMVKAGLLKVLADETRCHVHMSLDGLKEAIENVNEPLELETRRRSAILCSLMNHRLLRHTLGSIEGINIFTDETEAKRWLSQG